MSRKNWRLKPKIDCGWYGEMIFPIPTIIYYPWKYRYPGNGAFCVSWLGFWIEYGEWESKE